MSESAFRRFVGSKFGIAVSFAVAALGVYLLATHRGHVLLAVPYLVLLACPLMHLFGHYHHHGRKERSSL